MTEERRKEDRLPGIPVSYLIGLVLLGLVVIMGAVAMGDGWVGEIPINERW